MFLKGIFCRKVYAQLYAQLYAQHAKKAYFRVFRLFVQSLFKHRLRGIKTTYFTHLNALFMQYFKHLTAINKKRETKVSLFYAICDINVTRFDNLINNRTSGKSLKSLYL